MQESSDVDVNQQIGTSSGVIRRVGEVDVRTASGIQSILEDGGCISSLDTMGEVVEALWVLDRSANLRYSDADAVSVCCSYPVVIIGVHHSLLVVFREH